MERKVPKVGLALSGGATLGIAHVGVLKAFADHHIPIDYISGTSTGSLVAACFAFGMPLSQMIEITEGLDWKKISKFGYSRLGINTNKPMSVFITDLLGDVKIEDANIPLAIVATDIESFEMVVLREGSLHEAIRASTCIPGFFAPVELNGRMLVDGVLSENLPLTPLDEMGAVIKIGVNLSSNPVKVRPQNILEVISNSYTVLSRHRDVNLNSRADVIIEPDLNKFDSRKFKDADQILEEGYNAALKAIPVIKEIISSHHKKKGWLAELLSFFTSK
ncbi:TPA: patatin [Patescibacteria group bacterium]|nr:MAG: hypothetical protein UU98_C0005G0016 [Parcubacteria group bacterium GW2011_GWD2_42_14]HCC05432.1 patatin [Patescibacteria group bacterium]